MTYEEMIEKNNGLPSREIASARLITWEFVEKNPSDVRGYLQAAEVAEQAGHMDEAIEWLDKAERIAPGNFWPYFLKARILGVFD